MQPDFAQLRSLPSLDAEYRFGRPTLYLAPHELARLTILRSRLGDTRAERQANAAGTPPPTPRGVTRGRPKAARIQDRN